MNSRLLNNSNILIETKFKDHDYLDTTGTIHQASFISSNEIIKDNFDEDSIFSQINNSEVNKTSSTEKKILQMKERYGTRPIPSASFNSFTSVKKWIGHVLEVNRDSVTASVTSLVTEERGNEDEIDSLEFSLEEITPEEKHLVKPGAEFKWHIGHARTKHGQIINRDIIIFQTFPIWSKEYVNKIEEESEDLIKSIIPNSE